MPSDWPNQKSGVAVTGGGTNWQVISTPSISGNSIKQTAFGSPFLTLPANVSGVFTVEFSHRINTAITGSPVFGALTDLASSTLTSIDVSGGVFRSYNGSSFAISSISCSANTWYDIAIARDASNNVRLFVNGVLATTQTSSVSLGVITLPNSQEYPVPADKYILDEVRVTAACRYTANYTPSHPFPTS